MYVLCLCIKQGRAPTVVIIQHCVVIGAGERPRTLLAAHPPTHRVVTPPGRGDVCTGMRDVAIMLVTEQCSRFREGKDIDVMGGWAYHHCDINLILRNKDRLV